MGPGVRDQHEVVGDLGVRHPGLHPELRVPGETVQGDLAAQRQQPLLNIAVNLLKIKGFIIYLMQSFHTWKIFQRSLLR